MQQERGNRFRRSIKFRPRSLDNSDFKDTTEFVHKSLMKVDENIKKAEKSLDFVKKMDSLNSSFIIKKKDTEKQEFLSKDTLEKFFLKPTTNKKVGKSLIEEFLPIKREKTEIEKTKDLKKIEKTPLKNKKFPKDFFQL